MARRPHPRVLVVTGGMLEAQEPSLPRALARNLLSFRASSAPWLDLETKILTAEAILAATLHRRSAAFRRAPYRAAVERFFAAESQHAAPTLTEVVLATLLAREGLTPKVTTWAALHGDPRLREALLGETDVVFASTTLLRDASELSPLVALLARPGVRVVLGGPLAGWLATDPATIPPVDVLAVGWGEVLVPSLVAWMREGFGTPAPPAGASATRVGRTWVLRSGEPAERSFDALPAPDWALAEALHGRPFPVVAYESARGCPHRCAFCNYPLLGGGRFHTRSAARILADWTALAAGGARHVRCLDSLFTAPAARLRALCQGLIERRLGLTWTCYARADTLALPGVCEAMVEAGCVEVHVGLESGSQTVLDAMGKGVRAQDNHRALRACAQAGLSTVATVILGHPGETAATLDETMDLLRNGRPDVYYLAPLNLRAPGVPLVEPAQRARFGLSTYGGVRSSAPYWAHDTMRCEEVGPRLRAMHRQLKLEGVALDAAVFHAGISSWDPGDRADLLAFQRAFTLGHPVLRAGTALAARWAGRKLAHAVARTLP